MRRFLVLGAFVGLLLGATAVVRSAGARILAPMLVPSTAAAGSSLMSARIAARRATLGAPAPIATARAQLGGE